MPFTLIKQRSIPVEKQLYFIIQPHFLDSRLTKPSSNHHIYLNSMEKKYINFTDENNPLKVKYQNSVLVGDSFS